MPFSYFPPLPENIWGNIGGNIEIQSDLIELIDNKLEETNKRNNLLINPNFKIWQRVANEFEIVNRSRLSNVATLETSVPHGFQTTDVAQVTQMSDSSYDTTSGETIIVVDDTSFRYYSSGSDESETSEADGKCIITNRTSIVATDSTFVADRWIALSDANTLIATTTEQTGMQIESIDDTKFGFIQIVPNLYLSPSLVGKFSTSVQLSSNSNASVKVAILSWNGVSDSTTNDVVSSWNSEGTNPTLATNWHYEGVSDSIELSETQTKIKLEDIEISTSDVTNIAVFVWFDGVTAGENITINEAQLLPNNSALEFIPNTYQFDLDECLKFYQKSYVNRFAPTTISKNGKIVFPTSFGTDSGGAFGSVSITPMYKPPLISLIGANNPPELGKWQVSTGTNIPVIADNISENSFSIKNDAGFTVSTNSISGHYVCSAEI
ncbi:MAG: hypothetical protein CVV25_03440 [Ignavibacteriae bacterium HGW-Ignavibacteriae-4]|jgi:hypothetical protein|nr:MAG: hypothetical protein CVV25_03440 [Ignavibacteriae bacterium HGW-Ignavibacteriae-4]